MKQETKLIGLLFSSLYICSASAAAAGVSRLSSCGADSLGCTAGAVSTDG